uniref:Variant surface glycoprotein 1125.2557 n=1 Tax=Trypanosoma brucei TaxID=5691 RepID=A0A1J0R814_9TRYP|nr:variant surface glycoprotein 1125.2557 [Trypanosoma brucei]
MRTVQVALLLADIVALAAAAPTNDENANVYPPFCALLQLGDGSSVVEPELDPSPTKPEELFNLNMTVADPAWLSSLVDLKDPNAPKAKEKPQQGEDTVRDKMWSTWTTAAIAIATKDSNGKSGIETMKDKYNLNKANAAQLNELRHTVSKLADRAFALYEAADKTGAAAPPTDAQIKETINEALYGVKAQSTPLDISKLFAGRATTYQAGCEGSETTVAKTVGGVLYFLCAAANSYATGQKSCGQGGPTMPTWEAGALPLPTTWHEMRKYCPVEKTEKLTAETIDAKLGSAMKQFKPGTSSLYIYKEGSGACDGSSNNVCFKLTTSSNPGNADDYNKLQWIAKLKQAAKDIRQRTKASQKNRDTKLELQRLTEEAQIAAQRAYLSPISSPNKDSKKQPQATPDPEKQKACDRHTNKTACEAKSCKWTSDKEETGTHCKPKDGEGQTNKAGAGDGTAGEQKKEKKCKGKLEDACTKAPE